MAILGVYIQIYQQESGRRHRVVPTVKLTHNKHNTMSTTKLETELFELLTECCVKTNHVEEITATLANEGIISVKDLRSVAESAAWRYLQLPLGLKDELEKRLDLIGKKKGYEAIMLF